MSWNCNVGCSLVRGHPSDIYIYLFSERTFYSRQVLLPGTTHAMGLGFRIARWSSSGGMCFTSMEGSNSLSNVLREAVINSIAPFDTHQQLRPDDPFGECPVCTPLSGPDARRCHHVQGVLQEEETDDFKLAVFLQKVVKEAIDHYDRISHGMVSKAKTSTSFDGAWFTLTPTKLLHNKGLYKMTLNATEVVNARVIIQVKKMALERTDSLKHLASVAVTRFLKPDMKKLCLYQLSNARVACRRCVSPDCHCSESPDCFCPVLYASVVPCSDCSKYCSSNLYWGQWSQPGLDEVEKELSKLCIPSVLRKQIIETVVWLNWISSEECERLPSYLTDYCMAKSLPLPFPIQWWELHEYI